MIFYVFSAASKAKLEKETKVKTLRRDFALKLSKFLVSNNYSPLNFLTSTNLMPTLNILFHLFQNIDELQSLELFHSYLQNSYRESKEQLQVKVSGLMCHCM